ncbi:HNH endonuclease protein [Vibrio phage vB_VpP_AC2]|uniref:HNH endonuclease protein n=1 Tax=Vibrio phage vB_VpP_AC2 TaxID=2961842 RepID=A0A9E7NK30_9CAUD|nr:HNH endonuclease protein [Vibrio phage vB_VpP_AC2]
MSKINLLSCINSLDFEQLDSLLTRLMYDRVEPNGMGCLEWQGSKTPDGYGRIRVPDFGTTYTHRVVLALDGIDVDAYEVVRHICNNPACCNKYHIKAGTQKENVADMWKAGNAAQQKA